jgi:folate-dependent phosphoribosylglycinamide formyltransferase PurN
MMNNQHAALLREIAEHEKGIAKVLGARTMQDLCASRVAAHLAGAEALEAVEVAKAALRGLVKALEEVHEDPYYQRVWNVHQSHCGPYKGKQYEQELKQATAALARLEGK